MARRELLAFLNDKVLSWRRALVIAGIPMILYCLLNGRNIASYDNYGIQMTAASLVVDHQAEISAWTGQQFKDQVDCSVVVRYPIVCTKAGVYAKTPLGTLALALPVFSVAHMLGADLRNHHVLWRLSKWTAAWTAATCLTVFFYIACLLASAPVALWLTLFVGAGSGLAATVGQGLWSHTAVTAALMLSLAGYFLFFASRPLWGAILVGAGWGWMFASRLTSAALIGPMALWLLWKHPRWGIVAAISGAVSFLPWAWAAQILYGNPLGAQLVAATTSEDKVFSWSYVPAGLTGLLVGPGTGFFVYQTWAGLLFLLFRRQTAGRLPSWGWAFLAMSAAQLALFSCFYQWSGQHCWGTRYLTEAIPLIGLVLLLLLDAHWESIKIRRAAWLLGAIAIAIQVNGIFLTGGEWQNRPLDPKQTMEERSLDWTDPAFLYPIPRWFRSAQPR